MQRRTFFGLMGAVIAAAILPVKQRWVRVTGYGFAIPNGATINGVLVDGEVWGKTWTPEEINNASFGVASNATAAPRVEVRYTL